MTNTPPDQSHEQLRRSILDGRDPKTTPGERKAKSAKHLDSLKVGVGMRRTTNSMVMMYAPNLTPPKEAMALARQCNPPPIVIPSSPKYVPAML